jgi:hypothetical protein
VIIPPPEIKSIADKTAIYVAKNGRQFEGMIIQIEGNNPKFNFLKDEDDTYRPYYDQRVEELTSGGANGATSETFGGLLQSGKQALPTVVTTSAVSAPPVKRENPLQKQLRETIFSGDPEERRATN